VNKTPKKIYIEADKHMEGAVNRCFVDVTAPEAGVDVTIDKRRGVVHVNVDGVCVLRVCRTPFLKLSVDCTDIFEENYDSRGI